MKLKALLLVKLIATLVSIIILIEPWPKDIQEFMADYVMKHSCLEPLVDNLELEHIRVCSQCGKPMYEGYCIEDGAEYYCSDDCLHQNLSEHQYQKLYDEGRGNSYWTSWLD